MCCTRLAENTGRKNRQKFAICTPSHNFVGYVFAIKAHMDNPKKNLLNSNISPTCPHNMMNFSPVAAEIGQIAAEIWRFFDFSRWRLGFVTAATSLNRSQPNFSQYLAVSGLVYCIYIFGGFCPVMEFCPVQNSLCIQVLRSAMLAALLHSTQVVGVSQTLWHCTEGATYVRLSGHHIGHWPTF